MGRQRTRIHSKELIRLKNVSEVGPVACFADPKDKEFTNLRVSFDKEYGLFIINHGPIFESINEAIECMESEF